MANGWQDVRVSLGPDAEVTGKLSFVGPTRIEGKLRGQVRAADLLVIGAEAVVEATVQAEKLVILGEVRGQVEEAGSVQICAGGKLFGDLHTRSLVIEEGATFEGQARMSQGAHAPQPVLAVTAATPPA